MLRPDHWLGFSVLLWKDRRLIEAWSAMRSKIIAIFWEWQVESNNSKIHSSSQLHTCCDHLPDAVDTNSDSDFRTRALWIWDHLSWDVHPPGGQKPHSTWWRLSGQHLMLEFAYVLIRLGLSEWWSILYKNISDYAWKEPHRRVDRWGSRLCQ